MDLQLAGLRAVVTGGSAGIGAATVRALAAEGCDVVFCARRPAPIQATLHALAGLPGKVSAQGLDVTDSATFQLWLQGLGGFDMFIANVSALSADRGATLRTDVQATVACREAAMPHLQASAHGALTYIGSKAGSLAAPDSAAYGAARAAMAHFMKSLAVRALPRVRVNTVSPGDTLFDAGLRDRVRQEEPAAFERVLLRNPLQRLTTPAEVARVVAFISSPSAGFLADGSTAHVQF